MSDVVRLVDVRDEPLDITEVYDAVADDGAGAVVLFVGAVRDHDGGKEVDGIGYSAHSRVLPSLTEIATQVVEGTPVRGLAVVHRLGDLDIGELAVVAAVSAPHRPEAFEVCRVLIERLKAEVPIWKHQVFDDGTDEWVGTP
ncbi:molybdenum cofactor biosynthesis protein MoaE [Mumia zhuanghuii]|uniref:Molybdopterin synthase catalytic subunit 1 n=1 Tax=Mumia zhuanghuii TaxID=2585211 RepID=A0A5C4MF93_9ACTN|nr:molybdenum cofactor biosynthesis protein MoaE [Mumia zhuanghuii]TNC34000.1 molybdenum cofactor biosynthesis protein MoaE [Mumia zhuanghuii]TNC42489.1 molybdenum cofactor biosynthesis protein MoaE [Mumia zhuanghuii]